MTRILTTIVAIFATALVQAADAQPVDYGRQVAPIFRKYCNGCHNAKEREGALILDRYASLVKGGEHGSPIVAGKSGESLLIRVLTGKAESKMPPEDNPKPTADEIAILSAWIDAGATGPTVEEPATATLQTPRVKPTKASRPPLAAVVAAADGHALVARGEQVQLIRLADGAVVRRFAAHQGRVNSISVSSDGKILVVGAGETGLVGQVRLWNIADGKLLLTIDGHQDAILTAVLDPAGNVLATASYDQQIKLWDATSGAELRTLAGHNDAVYELSFRAGGKVLASASGDRTAKLWDVASGERLETFGQPLKELYTVSFSPDGQRVAAGGVDNRIRVWQVSEAAKENTNPILYSRFAHEGALLKVVFSADGRTLASSAEDRTVKVWDAPTMVERFQLEQQPDWPVTLAISGDNKTLLVGCLDGSLTTYDLTTGQRLAAVPLAEESDASGKQSSASRRRSGSLFRLSDLFTVAALSLASVLADAPAEPAAPAPPPVPEIAALSQRGAQTGSVTRLKLSGKNLADVKEIKTSNEQLAAKVVSAAAAEVEIDLTVAGDVPRGRYELWAINPAGASAKREVHVDDLPQLAEVEPNNLLAAPQNVILPTDVWGVLAAKGDVDCFAFDAQQGQTIVIDATAAVIGSKANLLLKVFDAAHRVVASGNDFDGAADPLLALKVPVTGRYTVEVSDLSLSGSNDHFYRLLVGELPIATDVFPLSVPANRTSQVDLIGHNLPPQLATTVAAAAGGEADVPLADAKIRTRRPLKVLVGVLPEVVESEPNDLPAQATLMSAPGSAGGKFDARPAGAAADVDLYRFESQAGQSWIIETEANRRGSPADTVIEVLRADGTPIERVLLQATRDSYITFRGIDGDTRDCRLLNWEEMQLDELLYLNGEVCKLQRAPQGPDSGFLFFEAERGRRRNYFDTTGTTHAVDEPAYIVSPHPPGTKLVPTGLPVFKLFYTNDDDGERRFIGDSLLNFTAPQTGSYLVRVRETRGAGGERFAYRLTVREPKPDFSIAIGAISTIEAGSGKPFTLSIDRRDGFEGPVRIDITDLPPGFTVSTPLEIQSGQREAKGVVFAAADAPALTEANLSSSKLTASATVAGKEVTRPIGSLGRLTLGPKPQLLVRLEPAELTIAPGTTITAKLKVERNGHDDLITFNVPNLPHGMIVDNIGLNGVLMPKGESERQIFLTAAPVTAETDRACFAQAEQAGIQASPPIVVHVRKTPVLAEAPAKP